MMIRMAVMYPNGEDVTFDMDYYRNTHGALVKDKFGPHGLQRIEIDSGLAGAGKAPAPYVAIGYLQFADMDSLKEALKAGGAEVMQDVPNFTNCQPVLQISEVIA